MSGRDRTGQAWRLLPADGGEVIMLVLGAPTVVVFEGGSEAFLKHPVVTLLDEGTGGPGLWLLWKDVLGRDCYAERVAAGSSWESSPRMERIA